MRLSRTISAVCLAAPLLSSTEARPVGGFPGLKELGESLPGLSHPSAGAGHEASETISKISLGGPSKAERGKSLLIHEVTAQPGQGRGGSLSSSPLAAIHESSSASSSKGKAVVTELNSISPHGLYGEPVSLTTRYEARWVKQREYEELWSQERVHRRMDRLRKDSIAPYTVKMDRAVMRGPPTPLLRPTAERALDGPLHTSLAKDPTSEQAKSDAFNAIWQAQRKGGPGKGRDDMDTS